MCRHSRVFLAGIQCLFSALLHSDFGQERQTPVGSADTPFEKGAFKHIYRESNESRAATGSHPVFLRRSRGKVIVNSYTTPSCEKQKTLDSRQRHAGMTGHRTFSNEVVNSYTAASREILRRRIALRLSALRDI
jgi:hypothetical protein